jgi:hypothetical protein
MRDNPEICRARGAGQAMKDLMARFGLGEVRVHNSELIPLPEPIRRDEEFCRRLKTGFYFIYMVPGMAAVIWALIDMRRVHEVNWWQCFLADMAWINLKYALRCGAREFGLFYITAKWAAFIDREKISLGASASDSSKIWQPKLEKYPK